MEEDLDVDHEREAEDDGDVQIYRDVETSIISGGGFPRRVGLNVGDLRSSECEEEEHGCANEFSYRCDEV
jgi:hypothetical protein